MNKRDEQKLRQIVREEIHAALSTQLLDTEEAAAVLEIGAEAFCKMHERGKLPFQPVKGRRRLLWRRGDIEAHKRGDS